MNYGISDNLVEIKILPWNVAEVSNNLSSYRAEFAKACKKLVADQDVGAIIVGGGPLSGIADAIADELPIPVIDGVKSAVHLTLKLCSGRSTF